MNLERVTHAQLSDALCRYPVIVKATRTVGGGLVFHDPKTDDVLGIIVFEEGKWLRYVAHQLRRA